MAEIINTFKQHVPEMRFIGKKYSEIGHWELNLFVMPADPNNWKRLIT